MSSQLSKQSEETILRPARMSTRRPPVNLRQEDADLFSTEMERLIPPTRLLELHGVRASADGYLFRGTKFLPESFAFPFNRTNWKTRSVVKFLADNYLLSKRRRFAQSTAWIVDDWSSGYFHWLADALTRLYTIQDRIHELVLLLPHRYEALEFVRSSLEPFGVSHVEFIREGEVLLCDRLFVPTQTAPSGHHNEELISGVRDILVRAYGASGGTGDERIYISRGRASKRRIVNEVAVMEILREFGFTVVYAEEHSFAEQVRIASAARYLVSNHGAGLTNMLFMGRGRSVLELRHKTDRINNCYFTLASALDLDFFYQPCEPASPHEDAHTADLVVDVKALREILHLMLNR
jgi:hypothetical protein